MTSRRGWAALVPEQDWEAYARAGYGRRAARGRRPALLVVDATNHFVGTRGSLEASLAHYPFSSGPPAWAAVERAGLLLEACRSAGHLVAFTVRDQSPAVQAAQPRREMRHDPVEEPPEANEVVAALAPLAGEAVVPKAKPSPFHGTPLLSLLVFAGIDSVVIAGGVTSGCVRATAVDAFSLGFRVVVCEDAVFDRSELCHAVNLFDLCQKYAEVAPAEELVPWLAACGAQ